MKALKEQFAYKEKERKTMEQNELNQKKSTSAEGRWWYIRAGFSEKAICTIGAMRYYILQNNNFLFKLKFLLKD